MKPNPIKEWLMRVATECGSPGAMMEAALAIKNENTRRLVVEYAKLWQRRQIAQVA